jgi:hypothetical protein
MIDWIKKRPPGGQKMFALMMGMLVAAYLEPDDEIQVHEWGVVLYTAEGTRASGASGGYWYDPGEIMVEAPVVFIYGPEFTGDLSVKSAGRIFDTYPEPDDSPGLPEGSSGTGTAVRWRGIEASPADPSGFVPWEEWTNFGIVGFFDAVYSWRAVPSCVLARPSDGFRDSFLYYEVDFSGTGFPLPALLTGSESSVGEALVFHRDASGTVTMRVLGAVEQSEERLVIPEGFSSEDLLDILLGWADGELTAEEVGSMLQTWEPYIRYGDWQGPDLTVFPMPRELVSRISTLELSTDGSLPVTYSRFFLGMLETP